MAALLALAACAGRRAPEPAPRRGWEQRGLASWYGPGFHGRRTANGEVYDMDGITAAHRTLPFGSIVEVSNLDNGRSVRVRINDRGPFVRGRIIDLSRGAAQRIGLVGPGTARVRIRVVGSAAPATVSNPLPREWWVQAGAFQDEGRARRLAARLRPAHPRVRVASDGVWHRVRIGPFERRSRAEEVARRLGRSGTPAIVRPGGE